MLSLTELSQKLGVSKAAGHKLLNFNEQYPFFKDGSHIKIPNSTVRKIFEDRGLGIFKPTVATIGIQKGGTGKTTLTLLTALAAARSGCQVIVIDLDPEACATQFLMKDDCDLSKAGSILEVFKEDKLVSDYLIESRFDGIKFLPSKVYARRLDKLVLGKNPKTLLKDKIKNLLKNGTLVMFDVPPNFDTVTCSAYLTSDIVIMPINSDVFSLESASLTHEDIIEACQAFEAKVPQIKIIRNKSSGYRRDAKEIEIELQKSFSQMLLPFDVKLSSIISNAINDGSSIYSSSSKANISARESIEDVFNYICPLTPKN